MIPKGMNHFLTPVVLCALMMGTATSQPRMIAYFPSWAVYARNYHVTDIPAEHVTHINYAFANIVDGRVVLGDSYADIDRFYPGDCWNEGCRRGSFHQLEILRQEYPHVRTLISVGGWTWSNHFSDVALTANSRQLFAQSCVDFISQWRFDGVDLDWEYPVCCGEPGNVERPQDKQNFTLLLSAIKVKLDSMEQADQREYLLTIATHAVDLDTHYELPQIADIVDWINVMTYDFHGPWSPGQELTNFNSALHAASDDPTPEPERSEWTSAGSISAYLDRRVAPEKLCLGMAFYGRGFAGASGGNNGLFQPYTGVSQSGTWENGSYDYWDLAQNYVNQNGYARFFHADARVPWLYQAAAHVFISYDDSLSIAEKGSYIRQMNLGGAMCWELSADRNDVLIASAVRAMRCNGAEAAAIIFRDQHLTLQFFAPVAGQYTIWSTTNRSNDSDPDGGADTDWTAVTTIQANAGMNNYVGDSPLGVYKNYVVTRECE